MRLKHLRDRARSLSGTTKEISTSSIRKIKVEQVDIATLKSRVQSAKGPISLYATADEILVALDPLTVIKSEYVKENLEIPNGAITHRAKPLIRSSLIKTTVFRH